ncbi:MAG TPA: hypothetical protein VK436_12670 [Methanocella sp.]|nr:hypothetical protein [Methanocella sp.]
MIVKEYKPSIESVLRAWEARISIFILICPLAYIFDILFAPALPVPTIFSSVILLIFIPLFGNRTALLLGEYNGWYTRLTPNNILAVQVICAILIAALASSDILIVRQGYSFYNLASWDYVLFVLALITIILNAINTGYSRPMIMGRLERVERG